MVRDQEHFQPPSGFNNRLKGSIVIYMKKLVVVFILTVSFLSGLMAATYPLAARKNVDLSGIRKIRFELDPPARRDVLFNGEAELRFFQRNFGKPRAFARRIRIIKRQERGGGPFFGEKRGTL